MHNAVILILDFGSQVTRLIARRIRESGVYCEIHPFSKMEQAIKACRPKGIILSGSPASVLDQNAPVVTPALWEMGIPILGICYGQQLMCHALGGEVSPGASREFGHATLTLDEDSPLTEGFLHSGQSSTVWMSHGDKVTVLPPGFRVFGHSPAAPHALIGDDARNFYAMQFHPEVSHSEHGSRFLTNFVHKLCQCDKSWTMQSYRAEQIEAIRSQVGDRRVICGLSGGVDSCVTALLIHEAIGSQLTCVLVDHGLMRWNEAKDIVSLFREHYNIPLVHVEAQEHFLGRLKGVSDPEEKRKAIGSTFIDIFEAEAQKIGQVDFLAQGTLYPDVIESVSVTSDQSVTIKSHHNVGGLPKRMNLKLVEPLRELFKDEVRVLGRELGLSEKFVGRHPFPGPGLAIRIPGTVTAESCSILRQADRIYLEEIRNAGLYDQIWQAFAVLLPVRSVGVMGDGRSYDQVCALRAVTSVDGMTADVYPFDPAFLTRVATRIVNEVRGINRVVYDCTSKPPGTIEWE